MTTKPILLLGTKTPYGKITAVGWVGERYYWCIKAGVVSMMPASAIEPTTNTYPEDK